MWGSELTDFCSLHWLFFLLCFFWFIWPRERESDFSWWTSQSEVLWNRKRYMFLSPVNYSFLFSDRDVEYFSSSPTSATLPLQSRTRTTKNIPEHRTLSQLLFKTIHLVWLGGASAPAPFWLPLKSLLNANGGNRRGLYALNLYPPPLYDSTTRALGPGLGITRVRVGITRVHESEKPRNKVEKCGSEGWNKGHLREIAF